MSLGILFLALSLPLAAGPLPSGRILPKLQKKILLLRPVCGNGVLESGEACDDGNRQNGDGCTCSCYQEPAPRGRCGNGICEVGETNVLVNGESWQNYPTNCPQDCNGKTSAPSPPAYNVTCGNCLVDGIGEECDDGNREADDGCDGNCRRAPFCGDGIRGAGEECDDGNRQTERCDYGARDCEVCSGECRIVSGEVSFCGDGREEEREACDDGNNRTGDGCSAACEREIEFEIPPCPLLADDCPASWRREIPLWQPEIPTGAGRVRIVLDHCENAVVVGTVPEEDPDGTVTRASDILLLKYNRCGDLLWSRLIDSVSVDTTGMELSHDVSGGVAIDPEGNIYVTGASQDYFSEPFNYLRHRILIRKYTPDGRLLWEREEGSYPAEFYDESGPFADDLGRDILFYPTGHLYLLAASAFPGFSPGEIDYTYRIGKHSSLTGEGVGGGWPVVGEERRLPVYYTIDRLGLSPEGEIFYFEDGFGGVLKLNPDGTSVEGFGEGGFRPLSSPLEDLGGVAVGPSGTLYLAGSSFVPPQGWGPRLWVLSPTGWMNLSVPITEPAFLFVQDVVLDRLTGDLVIAGSNQPGIVRGGECVVVRLTGTGEPIRAQTFSGGDLIWSCHSIAGGPEGAIYLAGQGERHTLGIQRILF